VTVNRKNRQIICVAQDKGSVHDFSLYKKTIGAAIDTDIRVQADSGYQGIENLHENSETPKKKSKKHPLTKEEKEGNRRISRERIVIENVNAVIKVFKIMAVPYRNRRKRHLLRMSLICGIVNFELRI
jgi:IS5 family transposase